MFLQAPHFRIAELWSRSNLDVVAVGRRLNESMPFVTVRSEDFVSTRQHFSAVRAPPD
jgi:hypothetical protein